ncbi:MAG: hypothetical protein QY326_09070 [Bdellovibrionota bacterium]|nr:MAG: hypothetical protein QY326_09070 [Bdellovibrionota bacterium]
MRKGLLAVSVVAALFSSVVALAEEDLNAIFKKVNDFVAAKNYSKALEELGWARKAIEKLHSNKLHDFFPDELNGYRGEKIESSAALGFTNIERTYRKGSSEVKISLVGGSGGGPADGLGGLAALGKMAAMMGGQPGMDTMRIQGRTATLTEGDMDAGSDLTVFLDSGSMLKIEALAGASSSNLKEFADALKINDLDTYLRGMS